MSQTLEWNRVSRVELATSLVLVLLFPAAPQKCRDFGRARPRLSVCNAGSRRYISPDACWGSVMGQHKVILCPVNQFQELLVFPTLPLFLILSFFPCCLWLSVLISLLPILHHISIIYLPSSLPPHFKEVIAPHSLTHAPHAF